MRLGDEWGHPGSFGVKRREKQVLRPAYPINDFGRSWGPERAGSQDDISKIVPAEDGIDAAGS